MNEPQSQGVRRPYLYMIAAIVTVAITLPLANGSGQMSASGMFDECFGTECATTTLLAKNDD